MAELNEKLANMPNLELLASDKEELQSDECLPSFSDLVIGSTAAASFLL